MEVHSEIHAKACFKKGVKACNLNASAKSLPVSL